MASSKLSVHIWLLESPPGVPTVAWYTSDPASQRFPTQSRAGVSCNCLSSAAKSDRNFVRLLLKTQVALLAIKERASKPELASAQNCFQLLLTRVSLPVDRDMVALLVPLSSPFCNFMQPLEIKQAGGIYNTEHGGTTNSASWWRTVKCLAACY